MFEQVSLELGGRKLTFETGKMARQAHGAIVARYGDTVVLATACIDNKAAEKDFLPFRGFHLCPKRRHTLFRLKGWRSSAESSRDEHERMKKVFPFVSRVSTAEIFFLSV